MRNANSGFKKVIFFILAIPVCQILNLVEINAQINELNKSINQYRKGEIVIKANPGEKVVVEQLRHEFWFAHPAIEGILMWGFWEGANWIPVSSLYKRDWSPTLAAGAYQNLIFNEWWTKDSGIVAGDGIFTTSAFFGTYRVSVNGISKEIALK